MCETRLYSSVSSNISRMIGLLYLVATMTSAGMFHAATSFLPSTLAMYTAMLGTSAFIDRNRGLKTVQGLFWFAIGGFLGWPFSLAMAVPLVLEDLYVGLTDSGLLPTFAAFMNGGLVSLGVLVCSTLIIDSAIILLLTNEPIGLNRNN